jgi:hypothetical protein
MPQIRRFLALFPLGCAALAACSSAGGHGPSGLDGGDGGTSGSASGAVGIGGSSGTATGGGNSLGGTGGGIELGGSSGSTSGSAGMGMVCNALTATSTLVVPTVLILVDNSSSMFETSPSAWSLLYDALMDPTNGVVKPLADKIRFGFTSYKGDPKGTTTEDDPACATLTPTAATFALDNYDAINTVYTGLGDDWKAGTVWETPTGFAINSVLPELVAFDATPAGPKYILLVTDGNPNTCKTVNPQCGQDLAIAAVQAAYAQNVGTFVIGVGDIVSNPNNGCNQDQARCGSEHLQDIANAGTGKPVQAPPADYIYQPCVANDGGTLAATYSDAVTPADDAPYFATNDGAALREHLTDLFNSVASCTFDLDAIVTGNPTHSLITLNGNPLTYNDTAAGWTLADNKYQVILNGSACDTYRAGDTNVVSIQFLCDEMGKPVAEPR